MSGSKRKQYGDWEYNAVIVGYKHIPLLTTLDGVRGVMIKQERLTGDKLEDQIRAIMQGGEYTAARGIFSHIRRKALDVKDKLREAAFTIIHSGNYGVLWWHKSCCVAWWVCAEEDLVLPNYTSVETIKRIFYAVKEVKKVRVECEAQPDIRRDRQWIEIYP